jgi:uncharacterized protein YkwD
MFRLLTIPMRLLAAAIVLSVPFYVMNLNEGMNAAESFRMLPSAYERGFEWAANAVEERVNDFRSAESGDDGPSPEAPGGTVTPGPQAPTFAEVGERASSNESHRTVEGLEDGREQIGLLEDLVHQLTNEQREMEGVGVLEPDPELADVSRAHSQDMSDNEFFDHVNLQGEDPSDRASAAGYSCRKFLGLVSTGVGENLWQGWLHSSVAQRGNSTTYNYLSPYDIADWAVSSLMDSPGHRANILNGQYERLGIGIAVSDDQKVYVTQKFC